MVDVRRLLTKLNCCTTFKKINETINIQHSYDDIIQECSYNAFDRKDIGQKIYREVTTSVSNIEVYTYKSNTLNLKHESPESLKQQFNPNVEKVQVQIIQKLEYSLVQNPDIVVIVSKTSPKSTSKEEVSGKECIYQVRVVSDISGQEMVRSIVCQILNVAISITGCYFLEDNCLKPIKMKFIKSCQK